MVPSGKLTYSYRKSLYINQLFSWAIYVHLFSTAMCLSFFQRLHPMCFFPFVFLISPICWLREISIRRGKSWGITASPRNGREVEGQAARDPDAETQAATPGESGLQEDRCGGSGLPRWKMGWDQDSEWFMGFVWCFCTKCLSVSWASEICCPSCGSTLETAAVETTWHQVVWVWSWTGKPRALVLWSMRSLARKRPHLAVYCSCRYGCVWKCCVPLNPMVLLIIIPMKNGYFIGNIPYFQTNPYREKHMNKNIERGSHWKRREDLEDPRSNLSRYRGSIIKDHIISG